MLLDSGLDNAAKYSYSSGGNNSSNYQWVQYTAVGTGASAPAASQTLLVAETARTNSNGGFGPANEYEADAANNLLRARHTNTRVFNFSSASNVSEFGHVPTSSGGPFTTRDLFRQDPNDPNSTPVTISVQAGDQLQLTHTQIIELDWREVAQTISVSGLGDLQGVGTYFIHNAVATNIPNLFSQMFWPSASNFSYLGWGTAPIPPTSRDTQVAVNSVSVSLTGQPYVNGSFYRDYKGGFSTAQANGTIYALYLTVYHFTTTNHYMGYKFTLTNPASFTKASTHTLELTFRVSWSRG